MSRGAIMFWYIAFLPLADEETCAVKNIWKLFWTHLSFRSKSRSLSVFNVFGTRGACSRKRAGWETPSEPDQGNTCEGRVPVFVLVVQDLITVGPPGWLASPKIGGCVRLLSQADGKWIDAFGLSSLNAIRAVLFWSIRNFFFHLRYMFLSCSTPKVPELHTGRVESQSNASIPRLISRILCQIPALPMLSLRH